MVVTTATPEIEVVTIWKAVTVTLPLWVLEPDAGSEPLLLLRLLRESLADSSLELELSDSRGPVEEAEGESTSVLVTTSTDV